MTPRHTTLLEAVAMLAIGVLLTLAALALLSPVFGAILGGME